MSTPQIVGPTRKSFWPFIHFVPRQTHFNFVGLAPYAAALSVLLVIGSGVSIALQQVNFGVDFVGGTKMEVTTPIDSVQAKPFTGPEPMLNMIAAENMWVMLASKMVPQAREKPESMAAIRVRPARSSSRIRS